MKNIVFSTRNIDDLISDVANEVVKKIYSVNSRGQYPETENPLGIKDVSKLIGKTVPTLYGYCQRNEMPYHKNGNRLIFFKSEIIDWIKTGRQKSLKELEAETDAYLCNKNKGLK